jgi:hypothetical protein
LVKKEHKRHVFILGADLQDRVQGSFLPLQAVREQKLIKIPDKNRFSV